MVTEKQRTLDPSPSRNEPRPSWIPSIAGTTVVGFRTEKEVVLKADSLVSGVRRIQCKILEVGGIFFASAGLYENRACGFSVNDIITAAISTTGKFSQKMEALETAFSSELKEALSRMKQDEPEAYLRLYVYSPAVSIVFGGYDSGNPWLESRLFWGKASDDSISIELVSDRVTEGRKGFAIGKTNEIARFMQDKPAGFWHEDPVMAAYDLIELEIQANPTKVWYPITVVHLVDNEARWSQWKDPDDD